MFAGKQVGGPFFVVLLTLCYYSSAAQLGHERSFIGTRRDSSFLFVVQFFFFFLFVCSLLCSCNGPDAKEHRVYEEVNVNPALVNTG